MSDTVAEAWEAGAKDFMKYRSAAGVSVVEDWAGTLPNGAQVLELGCGSGWPITDTLVKAGLSVRAIDASPTLVDAFRKRFPTIQVRCERVETSDFFEDQFDAVVMIGLIFLLEEHTQRTVIKRVADHLKPGGRFLFSSPWQTGKWDDLLTKLPSRSVGRETYKRWLEDAGLELIAEPSADELHHFDARKR